MIEKDCRYTKEHEWVRMDGDSAVVGITDHAQKQLGDITFIELPQTGDDVSKGDEIGVIESVKAASDLYSPLTGKIVQVNSELEDAPEIVNSDPFEKGWILKLEGVDPAEMDGLLDADAYEKLVSGEN